MEFNLAHNISEEIRNNSAFITSFSNQLETFFKDKNYGEVVNSVVIGVICVNPKFDFFFKIRKPKYIKSKNYKKDNITILIERTLEYEIKLDFEKIVNQNTLECKKILAKEIFKSLELLNDIKKKISGFDLIRFKSDLESYLIQEELLLNFDNNEINE